MARFAMFTAPGFQAARLCALLGPIAVGAALGLLPIAAKAAETVYDCRFDATASPLVWALIRHDDSDGTIRISASHLQGGDRATAFARNSLGREIEFRHEVRNAGRLENITSYRIDSISGRATGSVDLYDDAGRFIRGGPMPVDGHCTIMRAQAGFEVQPAARELCYTDSGPTQFLDSRRYCASSVLPSQAGNRYGPENLFTGSEGGAWCEGQAGNGEGVTIRIETVPKVTIYAIIIRNGYQKSASSFGNNGRVKVIEIEAAGRRQRFALRDAPGGQRLSLKQPVEADEVIARIVSTYPGARYTDTCLSGLTLDLEGP